MRTYQLLKEAVFAKEGENYAPVTLPHTWNAMDGQDGGGNYWRGIGTYEISLPAPRKVSASILSFGVPIMYRPFGATERNWARIRAASPPSGMS